MEWLVIVNQTITYWITTSWYKALLISFALNVFVYLVAAYTLYTITQLLVLKYRKGMYIDTRPLKKGQIKQEISYGIKACVIFAIGSLLARTLYKELWPENVWMMLQELLLFTLFYETYSYVVHRFLHVKQLMPTHKVHHWSIRVTPFSAYSVHPVEAIFIGISAPLFMLFFDISLGLVLILHVLGMAYTIVIHSNYKLNSCSYFSALFNIIEYHSIHHRFPKNNYGFVNIGWDRLFRTRRK